MNKIITKLHDEREKKRSIKIIDDVEEDSDDESPSKKLPWYLLDDESTFMIFWNFVINVITIYSLLVSPVILTFYDIYEYCLDND